MKHNHHSKPDFSRIPIRDAEPAVYRDNVPASALNNPLYRALPGPRTPAELQAIVEAGNPILDPSMRSLSAMERRERIEEVNAVFVALPNHQDLEDLVMTSIRQAAMAFPLTDRHLEDSVKSAHLHATVRQKCFRRSVGAGALFGAVGSGKTESLVQILLACPQVIEHADFQGRHLGFVQISWLYVSMPPKASAFGFLLWIAGVLDLVLKTNYWSDVLHARNHTEATGIIASALTLNAVGVVFCDELQNIIVGSRTERALLENTIQELVNATHTRFVFVGTNESRDAILSEALLRRMAGERGQLTWTPLKRGPDWDDFINRIWEWQATKSATPLTPELSALLHRLTGGVPDYAKKLFTATQSVVIGNVAYRDEQMTAKLFLKVMRSRFPKIHKQNERRYMRDNPKPEPLP